MPKLTKPYYERREELKQALYRIDGAITRYKQSGEIAEIGTIAIDLRGLLYSEALFLSLAREKGFKLQVYTYEAPFLTDQLSDDLKRGLTHAFSGDCVSLISEKPCTNLVTLEQWLKTPVVEINGVRATPERLINEVANNLGPAHYSSSISDTMAEMKTISLGGVPSYFRTLFTFAQVLLELGKRFFQTY